MSFVWFTVVYNTIKYNFSVQQCKVGGDSAIATLETSYKASAEPGVGSKFQALGPAELKERSPTVFKYRKWNSQGRGVGRLQCTNRDE